MIEEPEAFFYRKLNLGRLSRMEVGLSRAARQSNHQSRRAQRLELRRKTKILKGGK